MAVRGVTVRRGAEALLVLVCLGALSAGVYHADVPVPVRIAVVLVATLLAPVRRRLSPDAWLADGPRSPGRHALSVLLVVPWVVLLVAAGTALGEVVAAAVVLPGLAIGFVVSYALGDVIADYLMSAQFTSTDSAGDDAPETAGPPA
jgi:hypothetical protein